MAYWVKVFGAVLLALVALLGLNEYLLSKAGHIKTLVSDEDLWAIEREKLSSLGPDDIVLLGASRMQVNIDLDIMKKSFPDREVLQLALSGRGSSYPVFKDIVENTDYSGIIVISENLNSLPSPYSPQSEVVDYFHKSFSVDRKINKKISMWWQQHFLFVNPNSNSERLWGNLAGKGALPPPMFTMTYPSREQTSFFNLTDTRWLYQLRIKGVRSSVTKEPPNLDNWLRKTEDWKSLIEGFASRGGKIIFVHMPFSKERWELENQWMPKDIYWDEAMRRLHVASIHFADFSSLQGFKLPDTSHLDANSKSGFTREISKIIAEKIR